jgi:hypothetical protein
MKRALPLPPQATHLCLNTDCQSREWHVEADENTPQLWRMRDARRAFTIADYRPSCPICGGALARISSLETMLDAQAMRSERVR